MDVDNNYSRQVQLLVQLLPLVGEEKCFALKGGTAINLFVRDMPRLSVDIDLIYLPAGNREEAIAASTSGLERLAQAIEKTFNSVRVTRAYRDKADALRLVVERDGATVKIELSPVMRGTVKDIETRSVRAAVEERFGYAEMQVVSFEDLYAGKICAALDRQHPRDLFDVKALLDNEGFNAALKSAFIVYLISHNRPMEELLAPQFKSLNDIFENEFAGMTEEETSLAELEQARENLLNLIHAALDDNDKQFLCSVYANNPDWALLGLEGIDALPAVQWKLHNVGRMPDEKRQAALEKLKQVLNQ